MASYSRGHITSGLLKRFHGCCYYCGERVGWFKHLFNDLGYGWLQLLRVTDGTYLVHRKTLEVRYVRLGTADHVLPRWRGGSDRAINLVLSCHACNAKRNNVDNPGHLTGTYHRFPSSLLARGLALSARQELSVVC